jgi:hypothetical protein
MMLAKDVRVPAGDLLVGLGEVLHPGPVLKPPMSSLSYLPLLFSFPTVSRLFGVVSLLCVRSTPNEIFNGYDFIMLQ